jgi:hypothetical protein
MDAVASKIAECGGMLTHHAFQEMGKTLPTESSARKELCYRLEQGLTELVPLGKSPVGFSLGYSMAAIIENFAECVPRSGL